MRKFLSTIAFLLLSSAFVPFARCQFSNTIFQTIGTNISTTGVPSTPITLITPNGTTSTTYTFAATPSPLLIGMRVVIQGITGAGCTALNGTYTITAFRPSVNPTTFTTAQNGSTCVTPTGSPAFYLFITNIGQGQHLGIVTLTSAPAHVCASQNLSVLFQASTDGLNFFQIGVALTSIVTDPVTNALNGGFEADAAYPFLRVNVVSFDTTNCRMAVFYTGTLYPNSASGGALPITQFIANAGPSPVRYTTDYDSGLFVVSNALTVLTALTTAVTDIWCNNTTGAAVTLTIQNTAGTQYATAFSIPANSIFNPFTHKAIIMVGIKLQAGAAASINCQFVGFQ